MAVMAAMASLAAASAAAAATAAAAAARKPCTPPSDSWRICSETCCSLSSRDRSMSSLIISKWPGLAATSRPFSKRILRVPGTSWPCDNPGGATIPVKPLRSVFTIRPQSLTRLYGGNSSKARRVSIGVPDSDGGGGGGSSGGGGGSGARRGGLDPDAAEELQPEAHRLERMPVALLDFGVLQPQLLPLLDGLLDDVPALLGFGDNGHASRFIHHRWSRAG
mmetsp:Transcript_65404/g.165731  ORF Transcript_65404/g.165731 Transcript_65404/m.165731 type:complete len:221 (-) Transcript_65404:1338-2000(-)